jgi:transcriptional pleiotropic regulator of transition state genes
MKFTGIVRKIDELGRIVLPKELRRSLGLQSKASVEIHINEQNQIVITKDDGTLTGIIRHIDDLGRIVVPTETRQLLNINEGDGFEILVDEKSIILQKYERGCVFCGNVEKNMFEHKGKRVCPVCATVIKVLSDGRRTENANYRR